MRVSFLLNVYFILPTAAPTKWLTIMYILSEFLHKTDIGMTIVAVSKHKYIVVIIKFVKKVTLFYGITFTHSLKSMFAMKISLMPGLSVW